MIRNKKYLLRNMATAALLCAGLASCSHDDMPDDGTLPAGKYPLEFTASVEGMQSRASGKDVWTDGDDIGVRIGAEGAVGRYKLNADGSVKEAVTPVYWLDTLSTYVKAWYPYAPQENVDISDQSQGFAAFDFLAVTAEGRNYTSSTDLILLHSMAKVSCTLQKGDGVTDEDLATATVRIAGYTKASFAEGQLAGSGDGWITPASDGDALLVPQDMTGKPFIQVSFNGKIHTYTPDNELHGKLMTGFQNSYTIIMTADGIEVTAATGDEWTESGDESVESKEVKQSYTASDLKFGDYFYSDGTYSDGGLRRLYLDGKMKWAETTPQPVIGKTVIGIVFHVGQHDSDKGNYASTGIGQRKCHGYVVALTDVHNDSGDRLRWTCGPGQYDFNQEIYTSSDVGDWQGYYNSQKFHEFVNKKENKEAGWEMKHFPAAHACETYGNRTTDRDGNDANGKYDWQQPLAAPKNTSGWFLPSCGQLTYLYHYRTVLSARMTVVKNSTRADCIYKDKINWFDTSLYYWSSTEDWYDPYSAWGVDFNSGDGKNYKFNARGVRAVLAF